MQIHGSRVQSQPSLILLFRNIFDDNSSPSADSRRVGGSYKRKYVHNILVYCLVKFAQEKSVVGLADRLDMGCKTTNQTNLPVKSARYL